LGAYVQEIPAYWLYGEQDDGQFPRALHIETIVWRAGSPPSQYRARMSKSTDVQASEP
jgi:hypothetical protein